MLRPLAAIEPQVNGLFGVFVRKALHQLANGNLDTELLPQLADQALFKGFLRLALAARKLPEATQVRFGVALGDEQLAISEDQGGGDVDDVHGDQ